MKIPIKIEGLEELKSTIIKAVEHINVGIDMLREVENAILTVTVEEKDTEQDSCNEDNSGRIE